MATVTVRLIRSFEHRNLKHVVYHEVDLSQSVSNFKDFIKNDTLKISHKPHGSKSNDPVINLENDEGLILKDDQTLADSGVEDETEISFFKLEDYEVYKKNPHLAW
ncbi:UPF0538 protein C2orf76 homolog [Saccostrea cucullata]|uniref:UPF0538 protein C2orf76 homolog n=1 Tax=Saccostrea cuccullata TaxID=36930 RepID=UPI002ED062F9